MIVTKPLLWQWIPDDATDEYIASHNSNMHSRMSIHVRKQIPMPLFGKGEFFGVGVGTQGGEERVGFMASNGKVFLTMMKVRSSEMVIHEISIENWVNIRNYVDRCLAGEYVPIDMDASKPPDIEPPTVPYPTEQA